MRLPLDFLPSIHVQTLYEQSRTRTTQTSVPKREKFCAFMASHSDKYTWMRECFFETLSQYKQVDSGGGWNNNVGGIVGNRYNEGDYRLSKRKWLENYKFNICFENGSYPGYLTEKLFDAYIAGCIPIYWGDTSLRCGQSNNISFSYKGGGIEKNTRDCINTSIPHIPPHLRDYTLNPKAFINAHNFPTLQELAQEVIRIDTDSKIYEEMYLQPLFLENFNPYTYYEAKLVAFLESIFSQCPKDALRREENGLAEMHLSLLRRGDNPKKYYKNKIRNKALKILGLPQKYKV
ncbi:glycosyltransferase family 10 domain-containing protein [uncultured Helicobacter sp.]|uniref:glycosyltransferase family 10 domain-containing protein n=1 Tax=uncultured Helicobacter sp. TaxID=175537 RepID=UPI00374E23BF